MLKEKRNRVENTSPNWVLTNIQIQTMLGSSVSEHIWSLNWEKVPGSQSALWMRLQRMQFGAGL